MYGISLVCLSLLIAAQAQDPYYDSTFIRRPYHGGIGGVDYGHRRYIGGEVSSASTEICERYGETALHDRSGHVRTCVNRCYGYNVRCRRHYGSRYGMCCHRLYGGGHGGHFPDIHCPDGSPAANPCTYDSECGGGHHYRCVQTTYRGYRRGVCCRRPYKK